MRNRFNQNWALLQAQKLRDEHNKLAVGILWGKDKDVGNLYHAYCEFCSDCFVDGAQYKSDCESYARKHGWIIGRGKYSDIAICPKCILNLKEKLNEPD